MAEQDFKQMIGDLRTNYNHGLTRPIEFRKRQLKSMLKMYSEHKWDFVEALAKDLHKPTQEALVMEVNMLVYDIEYLLANIDKLAQHEKVPLNTLTILDSTLLYHEPYGIVLVMGPWNYPLCLTLVPVTGAIAAGNCVVLKPSEVATASEAALLKYIPLYMDRDCIRIVTGGVAETTKLLKEKFDYIFFTGSIPVGKIVAEAASKHLTPTTLELGGKSPLFLDDTVDWHIAVRRILWGKYANMGQTCVAPDYMLCTKAVRDKFIDESKAVLLEFYGEDSQNSPDLARIINDRSLKRLVTYLKDGTVAIGGNYDEKDKWIEPTVLIDVDPNSRVMQEEIFGPILPILTVDSAEDAVNFINAREAKPLAVYVFSTNSEVQELFKSKTSSGTFAINDAIVQFSISSLPFGGVGESGMGGYHGKHSYDTFTHKKPILGRTYNWIVEYIGGCRNPPYSEKKYNFLEILMKERPLPSMKPFCYAFTFLLGALSLYVGQKIANKGDRGFIVDHILAARKAIIPGITK